MKTKISHLGRSTVSVILAVMMLLSTMLIGTVSTVNAATNKFTEGETIYLDLSGFTNWEDSNPTMYAYFYYYDTHASVGDKIATTKVTDHIYSVTVPNAYCGYIQFQRGDWNKTAAHDADTKGTNNCVKVSNWDGSSSWSTYSGGSTTEKYYYVAGQKELINGTQEWGSTDAAANKMEYSDTDGYYSITYTDKAPGTYQFKIIEIIDDNSAWYGYDAFTVENGNGCTVDQSDETYKNISVKFDQKSNITIKFNIDSEGKKHLYVIAESASPKHTVTYALGTDSAGKGSVSATFEGTTTSIGESPASVEEGKSVTFTATAENGYRFDGWYSDTDCTTAITGATDTTYTTTVTDNTTVYAKFVAETYNITVKKNTNCTVTVNETAAYGSNVNVTVNAKGGYTVSSISVTNVNPNDITGNETEGYTFIMPASNVEITPNVVAVEVTAPKVTLNTVTGGSTASVKAKENYPITAFAEAGDAYSKITSTDFSVSGGVEGTDYTWAETSDGSGIYNFVALTKGTFTVTYTATATSKNDITKSTSATATLNITASYTPTQQAYVDLKTYVNNVEGTSAGSYTTDSYAAFSVALESAQGLLTGLPNAGETNASDYTNAKTALKTAFNGLEKDVTYYIGGRFKGQSWNPNRTDMQFVKVDGESNLYKYETKMTVSQLSQEVDNVKQYFFIHTGNGNEKVYYASSDGLGHTFHKNSINNQLKLKYYPTKADDEKNYIKFDDVADSSSNVVLYLDTSDKDNLKLYYSADIDPEYRLTGDLSAIGGWNGGYNNAIKFDAIESDDSYSKVITVTDDDVNNKYFKLINKDGKYYGPYWTNDNKKNVDICGFKAGNAYDTYENDVSAFYFNKAGTYKIHYIVKTDKNTPSVWVEENTTKYNVTVAENIKSIASVDKTEAAKGDTVTVTATPESGKILQSVTVEGANGTPIETTVSGNTATFTMPSQDVIVKEVKFRDANKYTVTFRSSDNNFGTVSAKRNGTYPLASDTKVTEGDTVTFTAKPESGYALSDWTVTVNDKSETRTEPSLSLKITADTTVVANFVAGTQSSYYLLCGVDQTFKAYKSVPLVEKGNGEYYADFDAAGITKDKDYYIIFSTKEDTSGIIDSSKNNDNANVSVTKVENNNGFSFYDQYSPVSQTSGNTGYVKFSKVIIKSNSNVTGFTIKITDLDVDNKKITYSAEPTFDVAPADTVEITAKDGTVRGGYYGKTTSALGDTKLKVTSPDGTTTITAIDSCNFDGHSQGVTAKKVPYGSTVTVKTTINPKANFAGHKGSDYYVKGFSINGFTGGVLTQQAGNTHTSDVYEYTFTVKEDVYADVSTIEITPIYFLKDDSDCITFYVENFMDAKAKWGDTIACYAYYSSGSALGGYPGQPMVNAEGSIYMQIPKHIGADASNVVKGITLNNYVWDFVHVSGDDKARESKNCQTYDYDDFKYLANMSKVNSSDSAADIKNIVYRFKYHTYNNSSAEVGNVPKGKLPETTVDKTKYEVFVDYYDKPTDIFGTIIKGNDAVTVDTVKDQSEYLTIVSDGYVNYYNDTDKYLGQYATKWYIYNKEGKQVAALPPSALLYGLTKSSTDLENLVNQVAVPTDFMSDSGANINVIRGYWTSFKSLYKNYEGQYAIINYESSIHSSGRDGAIKQPGERCDGRWYYSVDKAKITGDIRIEYADTLDSFTTMTGVKTDTFKPGTATGENTAAEAYFTSPAGQSTTDKPTHVETTSDNSENFMFTVGATSSTSYTFVGWYRLIDDTYKAVNDPSELNKTTGQVARNANVVLVARYIKTPGGSMTFHHSLYNGTNAGGGKATTKIQVVVKSSGGKEYYNSCIIDSTASIDKKTISEILTDQQGAKITVTLYTTTKNLYNFNGYYSAENKTDITDFNPTTGFKQYGVTGNREEGLVTKSEYTFSFNDYYNRYADILTATDAGTVYYNFYSDITSIKVPYKVQFSYEDREGNQKYYNKAGYVDPENSSSYTIVEDGNDVKVTLTDSFILSLAPYESNFTKNLTWDRPKDSKPFDSSLDSSIASAVVNSTQSPRTIHLNVFRDSNGDPTPRTNTAGAFKPYEKDGSFELPYGSVFYEQKPDGTYKYDITADKTYTDEDGTHQFMYWAIYSDPDFKNLVINAYNSEGHFSYVAYDNCWIVPVYEESSTPGASVKKVYTTTQFMEVTRNQWTADNADSFTTGIDVDTMTTHKDFNTEYGEDKLYADFVLNFFYNGKQLSTFDPNSEQVKAGVLIQRLDLDRNDTTGYITDLNHYANKYNEADLEQAKNDAIDKITTGTSAITSVIQQIDNNRLDNKNRLQYYTRFNNVVDNSKYVFRLYTYIQYTDANGKQVVELSNPVYFTFYDIANK